MVAAAIQGDVDCVDYTSHFRLAAGGLVLEREPYNFEPQVIAT